MKKAKITLTILLSVFLTLTMIPSALSVGATEGDPPESVPLILGDADLNGDVTILDATHIQRFLVNYVALSDDAMKAADANENGDVEIMDATEIQRFLVSFAVSHPIGEPMADGWKDNTGTITLSDNGITVTGSGIYEENNTVVITEGGEWTVTGSCSDGMIYVNTGDDKDENDQVNLRLSGMSLNNGNGPAIYFESCRKAFITLEVGTVNNVSDAYHTTTSESHTFNGTRYSIKASYAAGAIHADDDLEITGTGSLQVGGNYKHGVASYQSIVVQNSTLDISSVKSGINAGDSVSISGSSAQITIDSRADGIACAGTVNTSQIGSLNITADEKGIKTTGDIALSGGAYTINSTDDCINGDANVTLSGSYLLTTTDDAVHANKVLTFNSGALTVTGCYEGLEGNQVVINSGTVSIKSANDGINAAASEGSILPNVVEINGGEVYVVASGDSIDANGTINFYGGVTVVQGPPGSGNFAIDADDAVGFYGGTVVALCSSNAKWSDITGKQINGVYNRNIGAVEKDSVICITDAGGNVLSAVKCQLSGSLGLVYYQSGTLLSNVRFVTGGAYSGALNVHGYGTGGTVTGGTSYSPAA